MAGRPIIDEQTLHKMGYSHPDFVRRRVVLRDTLAAFSTAQPPDHFQILARDNLKRWDQERRTEILHGQVRVLRGDWGDVTLALTRRYGVCFAVLNMANAYVPGGAYIEGAPAQEENMYRRTDCHFHIGDDEYDRTLDRYHPEMTRLLTASDSAVFLDTDLPRICVRGPENRTAHNLGYRWLADDEVFPFFELRASAQDLRDGSSFNEEDARRRIAAQLDTLSVKGIRHAVLGAFGCGAFMNPARDVARIYREEIYKRRSGFALIAFAIFHAGYGPDNYTPFADTFSG